MENKDEKEIVNHLLEIGCCKRCALRMLCRFLNFTTADHILETESGHSEDESKPKRIKMNPCIVCLDILEESFILELVSEVCLDKVKEYDSETYVCYLSAPASVIIREHSIKCYLKDKYPNFYSDLKTIRQLSKVWKTCISKHLDQCLNKKLDNNSPFSITFNLDYESDVEETAIMTKLDSVKFGNRLKSKRKFNGEVFSRNAVEECLSNSSKGLLTKHLTLPPSVPTHSVKVKSIDFNCEAIFIAGRYCKYSRTLGQTPWVHEDVKITDCVQDFIFRGIESVLGYNKELMTFSASGREDYDVRCLGKGRPFYVQIDKPKITKIPFCKFRNLEAEINKSSEVSIKDMQMVNKCDLKEIKTGEQFKTKHYTALCVFHSMNSGKVMETINTYGPFDINQQTPLRVLHRRTLDTRKKTVHEMKAKTIEGKDNMLIIDFLTQAGTYVKELVHGDLKRTNPSISSIIGASIDILALDVNSINLDWPPAIIDNVESGKSNGDSTGAKVKLLTVQNGKTEAVIEESGDTSESMEVDEKEVAVRSFNEEER